jgi:hypothetical protein
MEDNDGELMGEAESRAAVKQFRQEVAADAAHFDQEALGQLARWESNHAREAEKHFVAGSRTPATEEEMVQRREEIGPLWAPGLVGEGERVA